MTSLETKLTVARAAVDWLSGQFDLTTEEASDRLDWASCALEDGKATFYFSSAGPPYLDLHTTIPLEAALDG